MLSLYYIILTVLDLNLFLFTHVSKRPFVTAWLTASLLMVVFILLYEKITLQSLIAGLAAYFHDSITVNCKGDPYSSRHL